MSEITALIGDLKNIINDIEAKAAVKKPEKEISKIITIKKFLDEIECKRKLAS